MSSVNIPVAESVVELLTDKIRICSGGSRRDSLGSDEPPSDTKTFFEAILVGRGLNLV